MYKRQLKGKHIAKGVRGIIIPATMAVYKECILRGWTTAFIDAGCIVSTPTCGPCLGGYMGILAEGERCVSTTNRNFVGRMEMCIRDRQCIAVALHDDGGTVRVCAALAGGHTIGLGKMCIRDRCR